MASPLHLDTHAVVWLSQADIDRFPTVACRLLDECELRYSPMVALELAFLFEVGKSVVPAGKLLEKLEVDMGVRADETPFTVIAKVATGVTWTRDPFDRLIVATAIAAGTRLLTKDRTIHAHFPHAIWDTVPRKGKRILSK